jgi:hypothetical protein
MQYRSDLTNLSSPVWNYFTRNGDKSEATCDLCQKTYKRDTKGGGPRAGGITFHLSNMRKHLENSHGVNLKKEKYVELDENTPNKMAGMTKDRLVLIYSYYYSYYVFMQAHLCILRPFLANKLSSNSLAYWN